MAPGCRGALGVDALVNIYPTSEKSELRSSCLFRVPSDASWVHRAASAYDTEADWDPPSAHAIAWKERTTRHTAWKERITRHTAKSPTHANMSTAHLLPWDDRRTSWWPGPKHKSSRLRATCWSRPHRLHARRKWPSTCEGKGERRCTSALGSHEGSGEGGRVT